MNESDTKREGGVGEGFTMPRGKVAEVRLKKIVVATDFSDCSRKAFEYGVSLARQFGAQVVVVHVLEPLPPQVPVFEVAVDTPYREDLTQQLEDWRRQCPAEVRSRAVLREGKSPHREIVAVGREEEADLIVVGNHGRNAIGRAVMGATAEKVVRHAPCPVLVIRAREHEFLAETP